MFSLLVGDAERRFLAWSDGVQVGSQQDWLDHWLSYAPEIANSQKCGTISYTEDRTRRVRAHVIG